MREQSAFQRAVAAVRANCAKERAVMEVATVGVFRNWTAAGKPWTGGRSAAPAREPVVHVIERQDDRDRGDRDERGRREELRGLKTVGVRAENMAHPSDAGEHLDDQDAEQAEDVAEAHPAEDRGDDR